MSSDYCTPSVGLENRACRDWFFWIVVIVNVLSLNFSLPLLRIWQSPLLPYTPKKEKFSKQSICIFYRIHLYQWWCPERTFLGFLHGLPHIAHVLTEQTQSMFPTMSLLSRTDEKAGLCRDEGRRKLCQLTSEHLTKAGLSQGDAEIEHVAPRWKMKEDEQWNVLVGDDNPTWSTRIHMFQQVQWIQDMISCSNKFCQV